MASLPDNISKQLQEAINIFWATREQQRGKGQGADAIKQNNRGAVTGGKQMDGFLRLLQMIADISGIPETWVQIQNSRLPGYFRPTKNWDFLIISPQGHLLVAIELKSQVGSFGNNFNNRTEEALGSAVDLWTAFRENVFPDQLPPWVGFLMLLERSDKSTSVVSLQKSAFRVLPEFEGASYLDRYRLLCRKMVLERHYSAAALVWTQKDQSYGAADEATSITSFIFSLIGFLKGKVEELT